MGLGKTVQVSSFIGAAVQQWKAFPALVVVPNSTLQNWVREFERWAPTLTVVPFFGVKKARDVIKEFEFKHHFHVLISSYETVINKEDFSQVFKHHAPWKVSGRYPHFFFSNTDHCQILVVDEGQRLKSDEGELFKKLSSLQCMHRVLMTGVSAAIIWPGRSSFIDKYLDAPK